MSVSVLTDVVARLTDRRPGRTEANVQSDLHQLLVVAPFELADAHLDDIVLESPAGQRRRIDVEIGQTVFEVKRNLRTRRVRAEAVEQLAGYVRDRTTTLGQRYVGVLTDGVEWHLYHLVDDELLLVSSLEISGPGQTDDLVVWLESVLATNTRLAPTPQEIVRRLGATSPSHDLDALELRTLYSANREHPEVRLKRELWAKLLTTALGTNFADEDDLFVEHTLLVASAEIIAHAVVGIDPADPTIGAKTLLEGQLFTHDAQVGGVVESDFFDWVAEVAGGERFVKTLARRLSRFVWRDVEHDVMKVLYESVISAPQRHSLGEYYTPDWLAAEIVADAVTNPLEQRVLDPGCGSGTFLFHAVRRYIETAEANGHPVAEVITGVTRAVVGVDVHPVAVTLARVTYLLAIGMDRLSAAERPPFSVPVYLGDSVQWGQEQTLLTSEGLVVPTATGDLLFADELRFPDRLLADAGTFDRLVAELADKAQRHTPGSPVPSLTSTFRLFAVHPDDQSVIAATFATMCRLHDDGRDHIWGYYVRNLARPIWLSHPENRVDVLVGNPPWLAYRFMPAAMQAAFRSMSEERGFWGGASVATHQDLSALFVARAVELYLREDGRFSFVMPLAALSRRQFAGFRTGKWTSGATSVDVSFDTPWDLHRVKPAFFPVPASVVFGRRASRAPTALARPAEQWSGRLPVHNASLDVARERLSRAQPDADAPSAHASRYAERFSQGASLVPRVLLVVERQATAGLGAGAGRVQVRSRRSAREKRPWRDIPGLSGVVERQFVRPMHLGDTIMPFRALDPLEVVIPWDGKLLTGDDDRIELHPGLASWWRSAEAAWMQHRSSERLTLTGQIDFRRKLSQQFPASEHRVVYTKGGMYLAAARISDPNVVIDHKLYWATASSADEAYYLEAILNSSTVTLRVRPLQARGEHNPRDFDLYVWRLPIPLYDVNNQTHRALAAAARDAETLVAGLDLVQGVAFESQRRTVREALAESSIGPEIEELVTELLS